MMCVHFPGVSSVLPNNSHREYSELNEYDCYSYRLTTFAFAGIGSARLRKSVSRETIDSMHRSSHEPQDALHARLNPDQMAQRPLESPQIPSPSLRELSNMQNAYSSQYGNSSSQYGGATPGVIANVNVSSQNERSDSAQQIQSLLDAQQSGVLDSQHVLHQDHAQQTPGKSNSQGVQYSQALAQIQGLNQQPTGPGISHLAQSSSHQQPRQGQGGLQIPASSKRHGQLRWSQSREPGQQNTGNAEMFACPSERDPCYRYPSSSLPLAV